MHFITQPLLYLVLCHARLPYDIYRYGQVTPLYIVTIRYTPHYSLPASEQYYVFFIEPLNIHLIVNPAIKIAFFRPYFLQVGQRA
jgi:hypothetical protein